MPSFIPNGPIVPGDLLQDLEDDRVVLFCGAGVSRGAGLPDYVELVKQVYQEMGFTPPVKGHSKWEWPDRLLGDLEIISLPGMVRTEVVIALDKQAKNLSFHKALLRLARLNRHSGLRLVTTNFDTFFEAADPSLHLGHNLHSGPILPIPRDDRSGSWQSLVHLHGRLEPLPHPNDHLIMTSADFGRAYLTEGWAARFVTHLFANFTVLFVGYSLNDPVLRYMTDAFGAAALAARRRSLRQPAFIFVPHETEVPPSPDEFRNRGLEPIFYHENHPKDPKYPKHMLLWGTLIEWAAARNDWRSYIATLVAQLAKPEPEAEPLGPEEEANLFWALFEHTNEDGFGAKVFAELEPVPPISWLLKIEARELDLETEYTKRAEAARVYGDPEPTPPVLHLRCLRVKAHHIPTPLTAPAYQLARWLVHHLGEYTFIDWVVGYAQHGHHLHPKLRGLIRRKLTGENLTLNQPKRRFWRIISSEGSWAGVCDDSDHVWQMNSLLVEGSSEEIARAELLALLRPYVRTLS